MAVAYNPGWCLLLAENNLAHRGNIRFTSTSERRFLAEGGSGKDPQLGLF
jgi:hypothetical protein